MKKGNGRIFLGLLVAVIVLGVGYAAISGVNLIINGSATAKSSATQEEFDVTFSSYTNQKITYADGVNASVTGGTLSNSDKTITYTTGNLTATGSVTSDTQASISVTGLTTTDEVVTVPVVIKNSSNDLNAEITNVSVTNNDIDYFDISYTFADDKTLLAKGEETTILVQVKAIAIPKVSDKEGSFIITFDAEPRE